MIQKWMGAVCIFAGCAGTGLLLCRAYRREEQLLENTLGLLQQMENELQCHVTAVPQLCDLAFRWGKTLSAVYSELQQTLSRQILPDASSCMEMVLARHPELPESVKELHGRLGQSLGCFDLSGQIREIQSVKQHCLQRLEEKRNHREEKLRSYQTLGLCAGAALAILFL